MLLRRAFAVAVAVSSVSVAVPTAARAHCVITYRLTSEVSLGSLLMTSDYATANGEFTGSGIAVACTNLSDSQPIFNDNDAAELLGLTFFASEGFTGPTDLAECEFEPANADPDPTDFITQIQLAGAPNGSPVAGVEVVVSSVDCDGAGSTTTSTTLPSSAPCGDPDSNGLTATDALFILATAVGLQTCPTCVCDVDGSGAVAASDALLALQAAVGAPVSLECPPCS